jgi:Na+-translocating ferredoxin:NAD+ oxidoreductase subunit B
MGSALGIVLWGLSVFTLLGLVFGFALAVAAARFQVPVNPLVERVRDRLPAANCGACGFAGCQAYAEAVVERGEVSPNLCLPGRAAVAGAVAELTGKQLGSVVDRIVVLRCHGTSAFAPDEAKYAGIRTCTAASFVFGGPKACKNGCLGLADCVAVCPFGALAMTPEGIPAVDHAKCTGCGLCVTACPKDLWSFVPRNHRVELSCVARPRQLARDARQLGIALEVLRHQRAGVRAGLVGEVERQQVQDHVPVHFHHDGSFPMRSAISRARTRCTFTRAVMSEMPSTRAISA